MSAPARFVRATGAFEGSGLERVLRDRGLMREDMPDA